MKLFLSTFLILSNFYLFSQISYYQEIFRGGVTASGTSSGVSLEGYETTLSLDINPLSTILSAFIIASELKNNNIHSDLAVLLNNQNILFSNNSIINSHDVSFSGNGKYSINTHVLEVTNLIVSSQNDYIIKVPNQISQNNSIYNCFYLIVLYKVSSSDVLNFSLVINDQNLTLNHSNYIISSLNPINIQKNVGLALQTDILWDTITDGTFVKINNNLLGIIGGSDLINQNFTGAGVKGCFNYENGVLTGLDDDIANETMNGSDGIAIINNYLLNPFDSFELKLETQSLENIFNNYISFPLVYSTPCQPFNVTVPSDTTICANSPLQLLATGGTSTGTLPAYEWQPATGLSCTDCPNPVFTSDSSMFYTVRIRSNDSCSVVRPLKINVRPQPVFSAILTTKSECFGTTGSITATSQAQGASYSLDGGALQSSGFFENLAAGDYLLTLHDVNGCTNDTLITIEDTLTVSAQFSVNPSSGAAPLTVQITNQSQHATDYEWFLNGASQGNSFPSYTFDTSGVYEIMLYAWQNNPSCIDSFSISIQVYDSLMIEIPNVFTPNNDGINEAFGVTVNIPAEVNYRIFNRWGNEMKAGSVLTTPGVFMEIWNGASAGSIEASEGVYFYQLEVRDLSMSSPSVPLPKGEEIYVIFNGFFELRK